MNRPLQRPPPPSRLTDECSIQVLVDTLYKTPYGEEDETVLHHLAAQQHQHALSWHALFRVWLRTTLTRSCSATTVLPLIRSKLQATLLQDDSSLLVLLLWDNDDTTTWKHDYMLQDWKDGTRYFVHQDIQQKNLLLTRQEQVDAQQILSGIDKLVGYCETQEQSPFHVLQQEYDENKTAARPDKSKRLEEPCGSSMFSLWVDSHDQQHLDVLLRTVERGPQWRIRRVVREVLSHNVQWNKVCCSRKNDQFRRGRALLGSFLLSEKDNNTEEIVMAPLPKLSTAGDIQSAVRDYLLLDGESHEIPNVHQLVLDLWDCHLHQEDISECIYEFATWLPIEPLVVRYQSLWKDRSMSESQILCATDFLCDLIGNEMEEWKEIWSNEFMESTWLPLAHAAVLEYSDYVEPYAKVVAVLERIQQRISPQVLVEACPQLGWMTFLLREELGSDAIHVTDMKSLNMRLTGDEGTRLPPLSLYIASVLSACTRPYSEKATATWILHVIRTLALYKQNDEVAVEWVRRLSKQQTLNCFAETVHRRICLFLWESNEANSSICLAHLLAETNQSRILSCTPPKCLFASCTSELESSLQQLLLAFGETSDNLSVIAAGLALAIPINISSATICRDILYQHMRPMVVEEDTHFVDSVERALSQHPGSLEWWNTLYAELVRNEVPLFTVEEEPTTFDISLLDEFLSKKRKRLREEDVDDILSNPDEELIQPTKSKARSRESASVIIRNLYGDTKKPTKEPSLTHIVNDAANGADFPENDAESLNDVEDSDDFNEEDDDEILLL